MTHTNHRQGTVTSLKGDWVVQMRAARGINNQGAYLKLKKFLELSLKYSPVNASMATVGSALDLGWEKLIDGAGNAEKATWAHIVFDDMGNMAKFLKEVVREDMGLSVIISGLHDETERMCRDTGIKRHTVQHSLGVWGKTDMLPHPKILEVTTMCGHGMISFNMVRRMAQEVRSGKISLEQAANELGRPCSCGVFNTTRTKALIQEYIAETEKV
ncbi:hypothetical protein ACFLVQ_00715 [Chloroflexota bacterium]